MKQALALARGATLMRVCPEGDSWRRTQGVLGIEPDEQSFGRDKRVGSPELCRGLGAGGARRRRARWWLPRRISRP